MLEPAKPDNEALRLQALRLLEILDTPPEQRFDRITSIARSLFDVPIALVSLVDADRQWFKSCPGLDASETPRGISFCGHAILSRDIFYIPDATKDPRFVDNPLVTGPPDIRFYAGAPLHTGGGFRIGTLCIIDRRPREFDAAQLDNLRNLADWVQDELNMIKLTEATSIIQAQEARLRALLSNIADAILTVDADGLIRSVNAQAATLFTMPPGAFVDLPLRTLLPDFSSEQSLVSLYQQETADHSTVPKLNQTTVARASTGDEIPVDVTVTAMRLPEGRTYIVSIRDISEAQRLDIMKREFVSIVSHELRTPLTAIRGAIGLVVGGVAGAVPGKVGEMLAIANKNCERLIRLVNDILDLEKIELGRLNFDMTELAVVAVVQRAVELNKDYAAGFDVRLEPRFDLNPDVCVQADEGRLVQVLTNLIANAVKFSPAGQRVEVAAGRSESGTAVRVSVRDYGPGIPEAMRTRIFEKFRQVDSPTTRAKGGTGLGLSIAKAIVEAFNGSIGVHCPEQGGSEFYFELPVLAVEDVR